MKGKHSLKAEWTEKGIKVTDPKGNEVKVDYGATLDNRSVSAYVRGLGFIGGWNYPHRREPWRSLVASINRGILYEDMNELPKRGV